MKTLLLIQSSLFEASGQSSRLARRFADEWRAANPQGRVIERDIGREPVPHLTAERFQAFLARPAERTPAQQAIAGYEAALVLARGGTPVLGVAVRLDPGERSFRGRDPEGPFG